jgi:hypothetical protein
MHSSALRLALEPHQQEETKAGSPFNGDQKQLEQRLYVVDLLFLLEQQC